MSNTLTLAIDPGVTTGWCLLYPVADVVLPGRIVATSVWGTEELKSSLDALIRACHVQGWSVNVVITSERRSRTVMAQKIAAVQAAVRFIVEEIYELPVMNVASDEWRPRTAPAPSKWFGGAFMSLSQKNAYRMARYAQGVDDAD